LITVALFAPFYFGIILKTNILQIETCRKVENALKRFDRKGIRMQVLPFHAAMTQESRLASMKEFSRSPSKEVSQFMICTDRYSSV
jgi:ATP-dependent RNA helicase DDX18/HAS1